MEARMAEMFETVKAHLLKQNARSTHVLPVDDKRIDPVQCAYRGDEGRKCAIGCLIPDERYSPSLEGLGSSMRIVADAAGYADLLEESLMREFLANLQSLHDNVPVESWAEELEKERKRFGIPEEAR